MMITVHNLTIGYEEKNILTQLSLEIPKEKITTIIGPNGCGKSTLLKTMARLLKIKEGAVYVNFQNINSISNKELAQKLAILPQTAEAPQGMTVKQLVTYGRFPHQNILKQISEEDEKIIEGAIQATHLQLVENQEVHTLSGGQRQRAWIAMALAQNTPIILLDEPTTYLDMTHQLEILQLLQSINRENKRTIVMVLHDLNHASRFSDHLIAMCDGTIVTKGTPEQVMREDVLREVFEINPVLTRCPFSDNPICLSYNTFKK